MPDDGLEIVIYGAPVPWASQAVNRKTGSRFIPSRQAEAQTKIVAAVNALVEAGKAEPYAPKVPLAIMCEFVVKRPADHWGTGRNAEKLKPAHENAQPCGRPDLSNLLKMVEDGLVLSNLFPDDDQVVRCNAYKRYQLTPAEAPRTVVFVREQNSYAHGGPFTPVKPVTMPAADQATLLSEGDQCLAS